MRVFNPLGEDVQGPIPVSPANRLQLSARDVFEAVAGVHRRCNGGYAAVAMIIAYAIIAVPTGIVTLNLKEANEKAKKIKTSCPKCQHENPSTSNFCSNCGTEL